MLSLWYPLCTITIPDGAHQTNETEMKIWLQFQPQGKPEDSAPALSPHLYAVIIPHFTRLHNSSRLFLEQCDKIVIYSSPSFRERTPAR